MIKILGRTERSVTIITYMSLLMMPITLTAALFHWTWPPRRNWPSWVGIGILGSAGQAGDDPRR